MDIKKRLKTFFEEEMFVDGLGDDESLLGSGTMDSTGMFELVSFLEQAFSVTIESKEVVPDNIDSITKIVAFINKKMM
jgi:acyl carrier protein